MRFLLILMMMFSAVGCKKTEQNITQTASNTDLGKGIVAEVDGEPISVSDFNKRYEWYVERFKFKVPKREFLNNLVNLEISAREAEKQGLDREDKLKYDYKILLSQHLLEKEIYGKFKDISVSDKELEKYFESFPEIRASHILFKVPEGTDVKKEAEIKEKALGVLKRAKAGEDFAKLSQKYSEGPSAKNGGDLDYFSRDSMVKEFTDVAFALKNVGDISDLVRTKYGYHIIKLTGRKKFKDADKRRLMSQLRAQKQKEIYEGYFVKLRGKLNVKVNEKLIEE